MSRGVGRGAAWTVGGYAAMQVLRFGYNLALARLVAPDVFGAMAVVNLVVLGLQMFSDLGLKPCVVQHPRGDDPDFLDTAWTVQAVRGAVLWAAAAALAGPVAAFYGEPALVWLVPLAAANAFLLGLVSAAQFTLTRRADRGPLVRREVGGYAATVAVTLAAVYAVAGPADRRWQLGAIAGGAVFAGLVDVALSYTLPGARRPRVRWEADARRQILRFGGWVFVSTGCTFLAAQADRLVVGKLSLGVLGVYHIAAVLAGLPAALVAALGTQLAFPLLAAAVRDGVPLAAAVGEARRPLLAAAGLLATGVGCVGPAFVAAVYDDRYQAAGGFVRLLAGAGWFTMLAVPGELVLLAAGRPRGLAAGQFARLFCLPPLLYLGYRGGGVAGLILAAGAAEGVRYAVVAWLAARAGVRAAAADAAVTALAAAAAGGYLAAEPAATAAVGRTAAAAAGAAGLTVFWAGVYAVSGGRPAGRWGRGVRPAPAVPLKGVGP